MAGIAAAVHQCLITQVSCSAMKEDDYLPLVSSRSPSFFRALIELDDHGLMIEASAVASLNRLVEAENDAREVCQQLADDTQNEALGKLTRELTATHAERALLIGELVKKIGGSPPQRDECRATLQFGPAYFKGMSNPNDIHTALSEMYTELRSEYQRCQSMDLPKSVQEALSAMSPVGVEA